jgi:coiled-coil and C2 domain-containing protein 2A
VWCTSEEFLKLGAGDWEEHAILLCNFLNHLDQSRGSAHTSYIALGRGVPEGDTVYTLRMDSSASSDAAGVVLWNAATGRGYTAGDRNCPMVYVDEVVGSENVWINVQSHRHPSQVSWDLADGKCWKTLFAPKTGGAKNTKNQLPAEGLSYVNTYVLPHLKANNIVAQTIERDLQQTLKNEFKTWRQEAEKGQKTYTNWDNSVSQALRGLLDSFEASKKKADGFSEDSELVVSVVFLCVVVK